MSNSKNNYGSESGAPSYIQSDFVKKIWPSISSSELRKESRSRNTLLSCIWRYVESEALYFIALLIGIVLIVALLYSSVWGVVSDLQEFVDEFAAEPRIVSVNNQPQLYVLGDYGSFDEIEDLLEEMALPGSVDTSFKTYMDYRTITNTSAPQYGFRLLGETDDQGLRRFRGDYLVALGTFYGSIGDRFEITLSGGRTFLACMGDYKADRHTDASNRFIPSNGNLLEFIIDFDSLCPTVAAGGDISLLGFEGSIVLIRRLP